MSNNDTLEVHSRMITAFYDSYAAATAAMSRLETAGNLRQHMTLISGTNGLDSGPAETGFWASLRDMFLPDEDRQVYAEGLHRGGYILSVKADEANYDRVLDIVDVDGTVDMDERETTCRSEGWQGYNGASDVAAVPAIGSTERTVAPAKDLATPVAVAPNPTDRSTKNDVISVCEESFQVGKRDVNHGRVRLRSYVVETPVSQQVNLRSQSIDIDRKAVDRAVTAADALFKDRVIEVEEHTEEAFVSKSVRVKEEISLRKSAETRMETVSDTVRHTEVEVDDARIRPAGDRASSASADAGRIVAGMDVIASDGSKIGTVDRVDGVDRINLSMTGPAAARQRTVPLALVDHIDRQVHLNVSSEAAKAAW